MGLSPLLVTLTLTRFLPLLMVILPLCSSDLWRMMAPGCFSGEYSEESCGGKTVSGGMGRKEPYRADSMSPSSVHIGLCTVTRNTLS